MLFRAERRHAAGGATPRGRPGGEFPPEALRLIFSLTAHGTHSTMGTHATQGEEAREVHDHRGQTHDAGSGARTRAALPPPRCRPGPVDGGQGPGGAGGGPDTDGDYPGVGAVRGGAVRREARGGARRTGGAQISPEPAGR
jgi:hypothetical protein